MHKVIEQIRKIATFFDEAKFGGYLDEVSGGKVGDYSGYRLLNTDCNNFYIREDGEKRYESGDMQGLYEVKQNFVLVAYAEKIKAVDLELCLFKALSRIKEIDIRSSNFNVGRIIRTEISKEGQVTWDTILSRINGSLVSFSFEYTEDILSSNCKCELCVEC